MTFNVTASAILLLLSATVLPAQAQNLVQNPDFTNGLNGYAATQNVRVIQVQAGNAALFGTGNSQLSQLIATTPGTVYTISFLAAFDSSEAATLFASFGSGGLPISFAAGASSGQPMEYSYTGAVSTGTAVLSFFDEAGSSYVTSLDVEAAPAPEIGTGGVSLILGSGLAIFALKRRRLV